MTTTVLARTPGRVMGSILLATALAVGLASCSGGGDEAATDSEGSAQVAPEPARDGLDSGGVAADEGGGEDTTSSVRRQAVVLTGRVSLEGDDLTVVRSEIDRLVKRYGGFVSNEETSNDDEGRVRFSSLELRVPSGRFDTVMASFDEFATVTSTNRSSTDVTTEVIDVEARIRTQEVSLKRLRGFLGKATDVDAMIRLESEIAQREATLESLKAQQAYLKDQTSLATIQVSLSRPDGEEPGEDPWEEGGFVEGLKSGWDALVTVLLVAATVAGAVLPFAVPLALLVGLLALWSRRRRERRTPAAPAPE